jgi:hypothetical protein
MTDNQVIPAPLRPWRELAEAILRETDSEKVLDLAQQLCDAVDAQVLRQPNKTTDA